MYLFNPQSLLDRAVRAEFITQQQADSRHFQRTAKSVAIEWSNDWDEHEGFGSSDMTYAVKDFLEHIGYKTKFSDRGYLEIDHSSDLPKNLQKRKENAEKLLGHPLGRYYCKYLYEFEYKKKCSNGNNVGFMLDKGITGELTKRQHTQIGNTAIEIGKYYSEK